MSTPNTGVFEKAREEDYAIRNEACPRSCICPSPEKKQHENEGDVEHERNANCNANPTPHAYEHRTVKLVLRSAGSWRAPAVRDLATRVRRLGVISATCLSLGEPSVRYRSSHRIAALSYLGDPRSA